VFCRLDDEVDDSLAIPTLKPWVYLYCVRRQALRLRLECRLWEILIIFAGGTYR